MNPALLALGLTGGPGRDAARRLAREELSRKEYADAQPPLLVRLVTRAFRALSHAFSSASAHVPAGRAGLVLLLLVLAAAVVTVLLRLRPARAAARTPLFAGTGDVPADERRRRADALAAAGQHAEAVRERLRAVVRELEDRGVLDPRPGRTADEVAADAGGRVPTVAADLRRATRVFDEVWYGGRPADAASYAVVVEVDGRVRAARLVLA